MADSGFDFSNAGTKQAVLRETLQHPVTLYSTGVGIMGLVAVGLFGTAVVPVAAAVSGLGIGVGSWLVNYGLRHKTFADRHVRKLYDYLETQKKEALLRLEGDLEESCQHESYHHFADQARKQFSLIGERFESFRLVLSDKLNQEEITFARYLGTAEQVYLSVLDNLLTIASTLKGMRAVNLSYIEERQQALRKLVTPTGADEQEFKTLEERKKIFSDQMSRINELLTENEVAITEIDKTIAAVSELQTTKARASTDLATAMEDLEELAKRAKFYAIDR